MTEAIPSANQRPCQDHDGAMLRAEVARQRDQAAQKVFATLLGAEILPISPETWDTIDSSRKTLRAQSMRLCHRLWEAGLERPRRITGSIAAVGLDSREVQPFDEMVRSHLIPTVARRHRAATLRHLRAWIANHPKPQSLRYAVFTYGKRVTVDDLPGAIQRITRRISRATSDPKLRDVSWTPHYRGLELGTPKLKRGRWTYHLHANVIFSCDFMQPSRWKDFLALDLRRANAEAIIKDAGAIQKPEEIVKYISKPEDLLKLPPLELRDLYKALKGRRLHAPMGDLRTTIRKCQDQALRPVKVSGKWHYVPDWNRRAEKIARSPTDQDVADQIVGRYVSPEWKTGALGEAEAARILGISLPCPFSGIWPEPVAVIWATSPAARNEALERLRQRPQIRAWIQRAAESRRMHQEAEKALDLMDADRGRGSSWLPSDGAGPSGPESSASSYGPHHATNCPKVQEDGRSGDLGARAGPAGQKKAPARRIWTGAGDPPSGLPSDGDITHGKPRQQRQEVFVA